MDVDSDESIKKCIYAIQEEHGQINVLVDSSGIERHDSIEEMDLSESKSTMETNYFGPLRPLLPTCLRALHTAATALSRIPVTAPANTSARTRSSRSQSGYSASGR